MDVFFYEAFEEEAQYLKRYMPSDIKAGYSWKTIQELEMDHPPASIISVRTQSQLPISWAEELKGILSRSTGYDHLQDYLKRIGSTTVACGYLPLYCHRAVAEQAMLLWMSLLRKLPQQIQQFRSFHRDGITGKEAEGKVLGVVGVGNIGYEIVKIGTALGMQSFGVDLFHYYEDVIYRPIEDIISIADIIVCSMNLTESNKGYFNYDRLKNVKSGTIFINISRGELSPSEDLLRLMREHILGGIGLDVFDEEKALAISLRNGEMSNREEVRASIELSHYPNVICTPHNAFNTEEGVYRKAEQSIQQIINFLGSSDFIWKVEEV